MRHGSCSPQTPHPRHSPNSVFRRFRPYDMLRMKLPSVAFSFLVITTGIAIGEPLLPKLSVQFGTFTGTAGREPPVAGARLFESLMGPLGMPALTAAKEDLNPLILGATNVTLYSLDSTSPYDEASKNAFHGWRILGTIKLTKGVESSGLKREFIEGLRPGNAIGTRYPQYGLRFTSGKKGLECVACFETSQSVWFSNTISNKSPVPFLALDQQVRSWLDTLFDRRGVSRDHARPISGKASDAP